MSGTDSKAGGREYLLQFMQGKSIAQKITTNKRDDSSEVSSAGDTTAKAF
jgi:delta 1-pyrroline-5-carboxylate dehydrogenase